MSLPDRPAAKLAPELSSTVQNASKPGDLQKPLPTRTTPHDVKAQPEAPSRYAPAVALVSSVGPLSVTVDLTKSQHPSAGSPLARVPLEEAGIDISDGDIASLYALYKTPAPEGVAADPVYRNEKLDPKLGLSQISKFAPKVNFEATRNLVD
jgi:hypothetical protein